MFGSSGLTLAMRAYDGIDRIANIVPFGRLDLRALCIGVDRFLVSV